MYKRKAINTYLALATVKQRIDEHMLDKDYYAAVDDYNHAIITGIVKIAAKMGISTIQSYQGSKIRLDRRNTHLEMCIRDSGMRAQQPPKDYMIRVSNMTTAELVLW